MRYDLPWKSVSNRFARVSSIKGRKHKPLRSLEHLETRSMMATDVVISEFLTSNTAATGFKDEDATLQDWIEVHNTTAAPINLNGWTLTDDSGDLDKWTFPAVSVPAGGYLVVFASEKDRRNPGSRLHTNFKLSNNEDYLALVRPDTTIASEFDYPDQTANFSYGLGSDNITAGFFLTQSPEAQNAGEPIESITQNVVINEIMYNARTGVTAEDSGLEYIEIVNRGVAAVNLAGWKFDDGIEFTFPNTAISTLSVGEHLVIAADTVKFAAKYPTAINVTGNWLGSLSNTGERIRLIDNDGDTVDAVTYADEGEWADRTRPPVDPYGHQGWVWQTEADGGGRSLELVGTGVSNNYGQNWRPSTVAGGTPTAINSRNDADNNVAPLIVDVDQFPIIPRSTDNVTITARLINEVATGLTATLFWRLDGLPNFNTTTMFDDGAHGDGLIGDGIFGASIGMQNDGTVVEYYIQASDGVNTRTYPAPTVSSGQQANRLYQVDNSYNPAAAWVPGTPPTYRLIMTAAERAELADIGARDFDGDEQSNAQMNGTLVKQDGTGISVRYNTGMRNRGHGSATGTPNNYHVNVPSDNPLDNATEVILNSRGPHSQVMGHSVFRLAGLAAGDATFAEVRVNAQEPQNGTIYAFVELAGDEFVDKHLSNNTGGNLYKSVRLDNGSQEGDLRYEGPTAAPYRDTYTKETNVAEDNWTDLINMTFALNNLADPNYFQEVSEVVNVDQWLRYIALDSLMNNSESGINLGAGDDFYLYAGPDEPGKDKRFILVPHDHDSLFAGNPSTSIFSSIEPSGGPYDGVAGLEGFLIRPEVLPLFYQSFINLLETTFNHAVLDPLIDQAIAPVSLSRANAYKQFITDRTAGVLAQIPLAFQIASAYPVQSGYAKAPSSTLALTGTASVAETFSVTVNGQLANWNPRTGAWTYSGAAGTLKPGINRVFVEAWSGAGGTGEVVQNGFIDIWYDDASVTVAPAAINANTTWTAANGPYQLNGPMTIAVGATLTIEPGTTVYMADNAVMTVNGRLNAVGTQYSKIRITRAPGDPTTHNGIQFMNSQQDNVIRHAIVEWGGDSANNGLIGATDSRLTIEDSAIDNNTRRRIRSQGSSIIVRRNTFNEAFPGAIAPNVDNFAEHIWGGIRSPNTQQYMTTGQVIFEDNVFGKGKGHNDAVDFDGGFIGQGHIVPQILNNRFLGGGDDAMDLEGDFYVAGNVLTDFVKDQWNTATGHSNGLSLGGPGDHIYYVVGNTFENVERIFTSKQNTFVHFLNNTVIGAVAGGISFNPPYQDAVPPGLGGVIDSNIFINSPSPIDLPLPPGSLTVTRNIMPADQTNLGVGNLSEDPRLVDPANLDVSLRPGSPAIRSGSNGIDRGSQVSLWANVAGEPAVETTSTGANLTVGGPGIVAYRYSLDGGAFGAETPVGTPISLSNLANGPHSVRVIGKNFAGVWQTEAEATQSKTWTVNTVLSKLIINEVMANNTSVNFGNAFPDMIELHNPSSSSISLTGVSLTDDPLVKTKWVFPAGTTLSPGGYLTVYADGLNSNFHTSFSLDSTGEAVYLYTGNGTTLVDSVTFGTQLPSMSVGRVGQDRHWALTNPTFNAVNTEARTGDPSTLVLSEWLADTELRWSGDFLELYNPDPLPVNLSGLFLTDDPISQPEKHEIAPLSFIAGNGFTVFEADENGSAGPNHLKFQLFPNQEMLALMGAGGETIDTLFFFPQTSEYSQGRVNNTANQFAFYALPTPGASNALATDANAAAILANLRVTEIMYNPLPGGDDGTKYEFIELRNTGGAPLVINGARLAGAVDFTFPNLTLAAGQYVIVAKDVAAFNSRYGTGLTVVGPFLGDLSNGGDNVVIKPAVPFEAAALRFDYEDDWVPKTDGLGKSLVIVSPTAPPASWDSRTNWAESSVLLGSPGTNDPAAASVAVRVFDDLNGNGVQDAGETNRVGVPVSIYHAGGNGVIGGTDDVRLLTVNTDASGIANFTGLPPRTFYLQVAAPTGLGFTLQDAGVNEATDSDVDATGRSAAFTLTAGQALDTRDAGIINVAPTVDIVDVTPDPTNNAVNSVIIQFSEPVSGFNVADLSLQRDGQPINLNTATLTFVSPGRYSLGGLLGLTNTIGSYTLSVNAAGSGITELEGTGLQLQQGATETWARSQAIVTGRNTFYNNSRFDNAAFGGTDDLAIATDKRALLPGQTATFANYTSYWRGINGIMIDVAGLPAQPTVGDFTFRMGNNSAPAGWVAAPNPSSITTTVLQNGQSRISIIWPDSSIVKTWLQVTMKANVVTGLLVPDVFYFGNAVGEAGNSLVNAQVTATDEILARNNPHGASDRVGITYAYDYNRDGQVTATDQILARNNRTTVATALQLITVPAASLQAGGLEEETSAVAAEADGAGLSGSQVKSAEVKSSVAQALPRLAPQAISEASAPSELASRRQAIAAAADEGWIDAESELVESLARSIARRRPAN